MANTILFYLAVMFSGLNASGAQPTPLKPLQTISLAGVKGRFDHFAVDVKGKLKGHPESFQVEQRGKRIFVNVPNAKHIAVIDRERRSVAATWPMEKFGANFPMAQDEGNSRLFIGCRKPPC